MSTYTYVDDSRQAMRPQTSVNVDGGVSIFGDMTDPKTGDPEMGRYLQHLLLEWLRETNSSEAEFARRSTLTRATINKIKNEGRGGGAKTVLGFARALGLDDLQLRRGKAIWVRAAQGLDPIEEEDGPPLERARRLCDYPEWPALKKVIQATRSGGRYSEEAWERTGNTNGGDLPIRLDEHKVRRFLEVWQEVIDDADGRGAAEDAEIAEMTAKAQEQQRLRKAAGAEGASPTPPVAKPKSGPRER